MVVLVKDGLETLAPGIEFAALKDIKYKEFVRKIPEANPTRILTLPEMQLIWDATVHNVFAFECSCVKEAKANEILFHNFRWSTSRTGD